MIEIIEHGHKDTKSKEEKKWTKSGYIDKDGKLDGKKINYYNVVKTNKQIYSLKKKSKK